jgi:hypothetical protein
MLVPLGHVPNEGDVMNKWSTILALVLGLAAVPSLAFAASGASEDKAGFCCPCCCE